jgi:Ca-activated chloride channel family protein
VLELPESEVLGRIRQAWFDNRKAPNIELVVDTSGSMNNDAKLRHAKDGLQSFLSRLSPRDRVGLMTFSDDVHRIVPLRPFAQNEKLLRATTHNLVADGATSLYDATAEAVDEVAGLNDTKRINAVVLLSDGMDTDSQISMPDLTPQLEAHTGAETEPIRVFAIAYGHDADKLILDRIAESSDGQRSIGDTKNIESVYRSISSFF